MQVQVLDITLETLFLLLAMHGSCMDLYAGASNRNHVEGRLFWKGQRPQVPHHSAHVGGGGLGACGGCATYLSKR